MSETGAGISERANWELIRLGFLRRLFATGSQGLLAFSCIAALATLIVLMESPANWYIPVSISILCFLLSLPGFLQLPYPILLAIAIGDFVVSIALFILALPLMCFSAVYLVAYLVAIRVMNAAIWIFRHGSIYKSLVQKTALHPLRAKWKEIADGCLPDSKSGFWGAESDLGPFWAIKKHENNILVSCSDEDKKPFVVMASQIENARLVVPKKVEDEKKRSELLAYPMEHILEWKFESSNGEKHALTLVLGPLAASIFAQEFLPNREDIRKVAARTSQLATASAFLGLLGPVGLVLGVVSLLRISRSNGKLKGQYFSWIGIVGGVIFTALFVAIVLTLPSPVAR